MGLRSNINKAVTGAFKAIGDIPEQCTFRRTASSYNASNGTNTVTNTDYIVPKALFLKFESMEVDKQVVLASDVKCLFQASTLPITPSASTDKVIRSDGKVYNVLRVYTDPAGVTMTVQLRSPS